MSHASLVLLQMIFHKWKLETQLVGATCGELMTPTDEEVWALVDASVLTFKFQSACRVTTSTVKTTTPTSVVLIMCPNSAAV